MIDRSTKLRWRRRMRRSQRQLEGIGSQTEENLDKHFFRRIGRLYDVRRFIFSWLLLIVALMGALVIQTRALGDYFLEVVPAPGGIYSEGLIGSYTNSNPIFASSDVDLTVSRLIYSGLLTYDADNNLTGDLASEWTVDESGKQYSFKLRDDVKWHDGRRFTSADVVYTFRAIQNPDTRSPLFSSWQGIEVEAPDDLTVEFKLNNVLASFPSSLTTGIIPAHILDKTEPGDLRGLLFNTVEPVGTGPFMWSGVEVYGDTAVDREQRIALAANEDFYRGRPKINEFIVRAYLEEANMASSFEEGELNAIAGNISTELAVQAEEISIPLTGGVMVFLRTSDDVLKDVKVRRALSMATDQEDILMNLGFTARPIDGPLLKEHIGYNSKITQYKTDKKHAQELLDEAGWKLGNSESIRTKDGTRLSINIHTLSSTEYATVANRLQRQWREIGVDVQIHSLAQNELQPVIDERTYDVLVYGIVMGNDPDQFAYWHSSQADVRSQRRLNFSDYKSAAVDTALDAGRTRVDPELRAAKYQPFLQAWRDDAPAIALYRPRFVYITYSKVYNLNTESLNLPADRFNNVHEWMIRTTRAARQ